MTKGFPCGIMILKFERKEFFGMFAVSKLSDLRNNMNLVLPEPQYHHLLCLHSTKLEALHPREL